MVENKNSKYFFRRDEIDSDLGLVNNSPPDLDWAIKTSKSSLPTIVGVSTGSGGINDPNLNDNWLTRPVEPKPEIPQILGLRRQEVSQDPQGTSVVSVTFIVTDIKGVEYEMRVTKA